MEHMTWHSVDKAEWEPGPWQEEPDKEQWTDEATGLPCLIVRNELGSLCGYVGVPDGHPWHGRSCWDIRTGTPRELTYSSACQSGPESCTICHVAAPGEPEPLWWLGFHCAYANDLQPVFLSELPRQLSTMQTYRPITYVKALCASLAQEAANAASAI